MERTICIILGIFNLVLTVIPLLASLGAIQSTWKKQTNSMAPTTFFLYVKRTPLVRAIGVAGDLSLTTLAITVVVAVVRPWTLKVAIQLVRAVNLWEASLGVLSFSRVIWKRYLCAGDRRSLGILILLFTWPVPTLGLCIPSFIDDHSVGLWLFAASLTVVYLVRASFDMCLLLEFDPESSPDSPRLRRWGWWSWRREEMPLGMVLGYDVIRLLIIIAVVWFIGWYGPHQQKEPFGYFELMIYTVQMVISNLLLAFAALPKMIRSFSRGSVPHEAGSSDSNSSSQEHINGEGEQPSAHYPNSLHKSENNVIAEPSDVTGSRQW